MFPAITFLSFYENVNAMIMKVQMYSTMCYYDSTAFHLNLEKEKREKSSKFIFGFVLVTDVGIQRTVKPQEGLTNRFTSTNHWF